MGLLPLDIEILPPCDDRIFKLILTSPDAKPALINLVSALTWGSAPQPIGFVRLAGEMNPPYALRPPAASRRTAHTRGV